MFGFKCWLIVVIKCIQKLFILLNRLFFTFFLFLQSCFLSQYLSSRNTRHFNKSFWFEPAMSYLKLSFYLFPKRMHVINWEHKLLSYIFIIFLWKYFALIFPNVIPIKTSFKSKWMSNLKLLPCNYSRCSNLIRFYSESAIFVVKHMSFLCNNSWEQSHNCPA